jgi:hypothetical protein
MSALAVMPVVPLEEGATLAIVPRPPATQPLYLVEEELESYISTAELVEPAQEAQFLEEFRQALATAVEKRDRIGRFFGFCENQAEFAAAEIKRLQARKKAYETTVERMEKYIVRIIEEKGTEPSPLPFPPCPGRCSWMRWIRNYVLRFYSRWGQRKCLSTRKRSKRISKAAVRSTDVT